MCFSIHLGAAEKSVLGFQLREVSRTSIAVGGRDVCRCGGSHPVEVGTLQVA